jgi:membrane protease YdiL (CAAX protease family)
MDGDELLGAVALTLPDSWLVTVAWAAAWTALMLAYSPLADRLAAKAFAAPPALGAFRAIQKSTVNLAVGIVIAWVLGGFMEEMLMRGLVLKYVAARLMPVVPPAVAVTAAVIAAAIGGALLHIYQGPRAMLIILQLSALFGVLFVASGYNLWAAILCHGFYDTVAFVRFASGKSRYARPMGGS